MVIFTDYRLLSFLHDSQCISIHWDLSNQLKKHLCITVRVNNDSQYEPWSGRIITFFMKDVVFSKYIIYSFQTNCEQIDAWDENVSIEFKQECERLRDLGLYIPPFGFSIGFTSGSLLEFICEEICLCIKNKEL